MCAMCLAKRYDFQGSELALEWSARIRCGSTLRNFTLYFNETGASQAKSVLPGIAGRTRRADQAPLAVSE